MNVLWVTIQNSTITLSAVELVLLISLLSCSLVFRCNRCGILTAYLFAYRWGWMVVKQLPESAQIAYVLLGVVVGALSITGMLMERRT